MMRGYKFIASTIAGILMFLAFATSVAWAEEIILHCEWSGGKTFDLDVTDSRVLLDGKRILSPKQPISDRDIIDISRNYISFSSEHALSGNTESYLFNRKTKALTYKHSYDANKCGLLGPCKRDFQKEEKTASCTES